MDWKVLVFPPASFVMELVTRSNYLLSRAVVGFGSRSRIELTRLMKKSA